jgi:hypothetical protein
MTTAERLIKNICEQRRLELIEMRKTEIDIVSADMPFRKLPKVVQNAFRKLVRLHPQVKRAEKLIERHGYSTSMDNDSEIPEEVSPVRSMYQHRDAKKSAINKRFEERLRTLENLRTSAHIKVLGLPADKARAHLLEVQQKAAKV